MNDLDEMPIKNLFEKSEAVFIVSEMIDNDRLVRKIAEETQKNNPDLFDGKELFVYQRMAYEPPYSNFKGLKNLQRRVREATGMRAYFKGIVAIDLYDWVRHSDDEFLKIIFMFLHDSRRNWNYLFTFDDCGFDKIKPVFNTASHYLKSAVINKSFFNHAEDIRKYIKNKLEDYGAKHEAPAVETLVNIFVRKESKAVQAYEKLDMILENAADRQSGRVAKKALMTDLSLGRLILNRLMPEAEIKKILFEEREKEDNDEKQA